MKRQDCTLENMKAKGWQSICESHVNDDIADSYTEKYLEMVRNGAEVRRVRYPKGDFIYTREVEAENWNPVYPRMIEEKYYVEYMDIREGIYNNWNRIMQLETIVSRTQKREYWGD